MPNQFIGRRVSVGVGLETTPGTEVAPTDWFSQMKLGLQRKTKTIQNESGMGRIEKFNDSAIVEQWAEGTLDGKVRDTTIGYLLKNIFGTVVSTDNADSDATIKDHTFDVANTNSPPTITFVRKDPLSNRRHGLGTLDNLDITVDQGGWAMVSANVKAKVGTTNTDTATYVNENEFTSKHVNVKFASTVGGLTGATAIKTKSLKLSIVRPCELFVPFGTIDPSDITGSTWELSGEVTLQYTDTTLETLWAALTTQAMSIALKNTDVVIGAAANPSLTFTMPRVKLMTFNMSDDMDGVIEQTVGFTAELDLTAGYLARAVLVNAKASY